MGAAGSLWNHDVSTRFRRIPEHVARQAASGEPSARPSPPRFQRRRAGILRDAIAAALADQPDGLRMRDIADAAAERLGESVPLSSIKSCLSREARSESGLFKRIARGRYCLRSAPT